MYVCGTNAFSPTCDYMVSKEYGVALMDYLNCFCRQDVVYLLLQLVVSVTDIMRTLKKDKT